MSKGTSETRCNFFFFFWVEIVRPSQPIKVMLSRSIYLTTQFLGRLSPLMARNWQLPFLKQRKGENDHENISVINLYGRMLPDPAGIEPATFLSQVGGTSNWATKAGRLGTIQCHLAFRRKSTISLSTLHLIAPLPWCKNILWRMLTAINWENVPFWKRAPSIASNQSAHPRKKNRNQSLQCPYDETLYSLAITNAPRADSDQTARIHKLIWIFLASKSKKVRFLTFGLNL